MYPIAKARSLYIECGVIETRRPWESESQFNSDIRYHSHGGGFNMGNVLSQEILLQRISNNFKQNVILIGKYKNRREKVSCRWIYDIK